VELVGSNGPRAPAKFFGCDPYAHTAGSPGDKPFRPTSRASEAVDKACSNYPLTGPLRSRGRPRGAYLRGMNARCNSRTRSPNRHQCAERIGGRGRHVGYNDSKGAVRTLTKAAAVQHGADNTRVNSVHPGLMPPMRSSGTHRGPRGARQDAAADTVGALRPGRGGPYAVLFLAPTRPPTSPAPNSGSTAALWRDRLQPSLSGAA
jgi:NAD(P)-dependent dehydrogenase (short-subunit alcohol dehydrogenase family)